MGRCSAALTMKQVYTSENRFLVANARNILEAEGIEVTVRNEHASSAMGELSPLDTWMELWVINECDYERACNILDTSLSQSSAPEWTCSNCGESLVCCFSNFGDNGFFLFQIKRHESPPDYYAGIISKTDVHI